MLAPAKKLGRFNANMQRVDAGYLYDLGDAVRALRPFRLRDVPAYEIWQPLTDCRQKLAAFLHSSVYAKSLRGVLHVPANAFLTAIDTLTGRILAEQLATVTTTDQIPLQQAYERFEPVLSAELSSQVLYLVTPKGVYDVIALAEQGSQLFPQSLAWKTPEATRDVEQGAKALAFELWSAAAFHFHRAIEAVLRRYYDHCCGPNQRPKICTMGSMLAKMEKENKGEKQVIVALQNIAEFHRNPNIHPGDFIDDAEQAFSLVAAIRAAMGYMLDLLPIASFDAMMKATPNPGINVAPPPLALEGDTA
jgi:hypothetical protein